MVKINRHERICSLLTNVSWIPKLDVAGSVPVSRSMFSITWEDRKTLVTPFSFQTSPESRVSLLNHLRFEALQCFTLLLKITERIDLHTDAQTTAPLIGRDLVVDLGFPGQAGVCPAQNLECGHSSPTVSSFGRMCRFQRLSRLRGVFRSVRNRASASLLGILPQRPRTFDFFRPCSHHCATQTFWRPCLRGRTLPF
jgi:hypothetical protein